MQLPDITATFCVIASGQRPQRAGYLVRHSLDLAAMNVAAQRLLGEHDFSAFRAASCQVSNPHRSVSACDVHRRGALVFVDITANAFLHHMVRNIGLAICRGHCNAISRVV